MRISSSEYSTARASAEYVPVSMAANFAGRRCSHCTANETTACRPVRPLVASFTLTNCQRCAKIHVRHVKLHSEACAFGQFCSGERFGPAALSTDKSLDPFVHAR
jgi:hypothetical protein